MELVKQVHKFLEQPFPLWETNLTQLLIQHKWDELQKQGLNSLVDYNTVRVWHKNPAFEMGKKILVAQNGTNYLYLETPFFDLLQSFYHEHNLEPLTENELESNAALLKLKKAISTLKDVESAYDCITELVRSVQVLRQPDAEIDVSYSHPQIPFTIFVSVCVDDSTISDLRLAESILHETMHLKLSLIEEVVPLIKPDTSSLYYSPWRDEERPVRGVLHGLFVFRAIYELYSTIAKNFVDQKVKNFLYHRLKDIHSEISFLNNFYCNNTLSELGKHFAFNLIQYQIV